MAIDVFEAIPCLDTERYLKSGYLDHPIDRTNDLHREPLVPLCDYGVDGVSYYSQPNSVTGDPVEGLTPHIFVRRTIAEKLAAADHFLLANDDVTLMFDTPIRLFVRDGFRPPQLQAYLYDIYFPQLLRGQNPSWSDEQVMARRSEVMAEPKNEIGAVSPHATGAAVDVIIVSAEDGSIINTGFKHATLGENDIYTDHLESIDTPPADLALALQARRVLYNTMLSAEVGGIAMRNNPTETWHYSYGDQMWALLGAHPAAFYGFPPDMPDELIFS